MLPLFPEFAPIDLSQKSTVEAITQGHDPYSDFNFVSMYCWDKGDIALSTLHGNLVVRFNDYIQPEKKFLSFLGVDNPDETAAALLTFSREQYHHDALELIPEVTARHIDTTQFLVVADENQHDYVYSIREHCTLEGSKFKKRRNVMKKFIEEYGETASVSCEQDLSNERWHEILSVVKKWGDGKKEAHAYSAEEYAAFLRLRECHTLSDFFYFFVTVRDELVGISVAEVINDDYVITHFEKILPVHGGIGSFAMNKIAAILNQYGFSYINFMQDIGIPGMKRNKQLRRPVHMLHKYIVRAR